MINAITSALSGLSAASNKIEQSAQNIAQGGVEVTTDGRVIEDIVDIKAAEVSYKANIEVLRTANELTQELLNSFDETV